MFNRKILTMISFTGAGFFIFVLSIIFISWYTTTIWDENNFPNPMINITGCNMAYPSHICDPDSVIFSKTFRNKLASKLDLIAEITQNLNISENLNSTDESCQRKGVTAAIALAKNFHDYSEEGMKKFAKATLSKWNLDSECKKSFLIFVFHQDESKNVDEITEFSIALDSNVPFTECGFWKIYHSIGFRDNIEKDLNLMLEKIVKMIENGEDSDSECTKDEAWHLIVGPWGMIVFTVILILCCISFCFWKFRCICTLNDGSSTDLTTTTINQHETTANEMLIQKL